MESRSKVLTILESWAKPEILQDVYCNNYEEWADNLLYTLETEGKTNNPEVKLTVKDLHFIKSNSIEYWIQANKGETDLVEAVINSFIGFCNLNSLTVSGGKIVKEIK